MRNLNKISKHFTLVTLSSNFTRSSETSTYRVLNNFTTSTYTEKLPVTNH